MTKLFISVLGGRRTWYVKERMEEEKEGERELGKKLGIGEERKEAFKEEADLAQSEWKSYQIVFRKNTLSNGW